MWSFAYESIYGNGTLYNPIMLQLTSWSTAVVPHDPGCRHLRPHQRLLPPVPASCHCMVTRLAERRLMINVYESISA